MSDEHFARLVPRSNSIADIVAAVSAQANRHELSLQAQKATAARVGDLEAAVRDLDTRVESDAAERKIERARADHATKRLGVALVFAATLLAPAVTALVNYLTRPPIVAGALAPRSAFDRELDVCNNLPDPALRGKCAVDVAAANVR
jgi:hypothetical protein